MQHLKIFCCISTFYFSCPCDGFLGRPEGRIFPFVTHGLVPEFHLNKAHYITACSCSPETIPTSPLECGDTRREAGTWLISSHTRRVTCHVSRVTQARRFTAQDPSQLHDIYSTLFIFMVTSEQTRSDSKNPDLQLILNTDTQKVSWGNAPLAGYRMLRYIHTLL